jgi:hypothetical protein
MDNNLDIHQELPEVASLEEIQDCLNEFRRQINSILGKRQFDPIRRRNLALFPICMPPTYELVKLLIFCT